MNLNFDIIFKSLFPDFLGLGGKMKLSGIKVN